MRIARNPGGRDFPPVRERPDVRAHAFIGGNAAMLDLLRTNAASFGIESSTPALERLAAAARKQLAHNTATISIDRIEREADRLRFDVTIVNLTGHKLPTGYPSRRAWLYVGARDGDRLLFESGAADADGRLEGVEDELSLPHHDVIDAPTKVQVYELVAHDASGKPTTRLIEMARRAKDNRLLPRGWRADGLHAETTKPIGAEGDPDFTGGRDTVTYVVDLPSDAGDEIEIIVFFVYQSIPPAWVQPLDEIDAPQVQRFLSIYEPGSPEIIATANLLVRTAASRSE
jgi:hypothetical protein